MLFQWYPYTMKAEENGTLVYTGLCIDLLDIMANHFNFRYVHELDVMLLGFTMKN